MKYLSTIIFTLLVSISFSQEHVHGAWCGTEISNEWMQEFYQRDQNHLNRRSLERREVPIIYHILGTDVGTGYYTMQNLLRLHCDFQTALLPANIHFWVKDIKYINSTAYYNGDNTNQLFNSYNDLNVLNIYIVASMTGVCGYSYVPSAPSTGTGFAGPNRGGIMLAQNCLLPGSTTLIHEAGHYFNLPHTFFGWENQDAPATNQSAPATIGGGWWSMPVERLDGTNCLTAGDGFCDTPPDYISQRWTCNNTTGQSNVQYQDPTGTSFRIDGKNFMSYANDACTEYFSTQQFAEMNNTPVTHRPYLLNNTSPNMTPLTTAEVVFPNNFFRISTGIPINLQWKKVERAEYYLVQASINNNFFNLQVNEIVTDTFFTMANIQANRNYIWRVRAFSYANMCTDFSEEARFSTSNFAIGIDIENESCFGITDAQASLITTGITGNLTYSWSAQDPFVNSQLTQNNTNQITNIGAGFYIATILRNFVDTIRIPFNISTQSPEINLGFYQFGTTLGVNISGGTPPYLYVWGNGSSENVETNPTEGFNEFLLVDSLGCRKTGGFNFSSALVGLSNNSNFVEFNIYPNPTTNSTFNVELELNTQENVTVEVFNLNGQIVAQKQLNSTIGKSIFEINIPNISTGICFVKISSSSETTVKKITFM